VSGTHGLLRFNLCPNLLLWSERPASNQIIITLSLFLYFHIMAPVWQKIESVGPYNNREILWLSKPGHPKIIFSVIAPKARKSVPSREKNGRNTYIGAGDDYAAA
jgi:hypothetical protein